VRSSSPARDSSRVQAAQPNASPPAGRRLTLALALAVLAAGSAQAAGLYLHVLPAVNRSGARLDAPGLRVSAYARDPHALAQRFASGIEAVERDHVELALHVYPQLRPLEVERFRAPSFVIDFEEPALAALRGRLADGSDSGERLRRLVDEAIPDKSMARGWDLASQVAGSGSGDCTEHAVLLTALARAAGRPARVALGLLLVQQHGRVHAFGHAWSELHEAGRWRPVDATPISDQVEAVAYLPTAILVNEGPGYAIELARGMQTTWVQRVVVE
jgi:transglutaminase-like putative cysteine protease